MKSHLYAVILAGGSGTRFWPKSRLSLPKQFLDVTGEGSLFEQTLERIKPLVVPERILVVTSFRYRGLIEKILKKYQVPMANVLFEPSGKNTAPAIGWAAQVIAQRDSAAVMMVLPSDHLVQNKINFVKSVRSAVGLAEDNYLVTSGITPTHPETGYGYLKVKSISQRLIRLRRTKETHSTGSGREGKSILKVVKFTEKPNLAKAKQFIRSKNYLWNGGIFVWRPTVILDEFTRFMPQMAGLLAKITSKNIKKIWPEIESISIDYAILEKSKKVVAVKADGLGWSDLGSWQALADILPKDAQVNSLRGPVLNVGSENVLAWADKRTVAVVGLKDIVIVDTPDALLVCRRDCAQDVKKVVDILAKQNKGLVA